MARSTQPHRPPPGRARPGWPLFVALLVLGAVAGLFSVSAPAQGPEPYRITVSPGAQNYPIALPLPVDLAGVEGDQARELWEVVRRDLEMTGYFDIIDPNAYLDQSDGVEVGSFPFEPWRRIRAIALAKSRMQMMDGRLAADIFVYDVGAGDRISARRFLGEADDLRYLGHRIADHILLSLTGEKGLFGTRLTAVGERTGNKEIYVMDIDGHGIAPVTRNGSINLSPAWSPDGGQVAWTSYKRGNPDIYAKDLASGRTRVLSNRPGINIGAAYSPDGTKVALARSTGGTTDIYVIDASTGREIQRVTRGGGIDVSPAWSPDGTKLAFSSERSGGSQIFVSDLESGETRRVTFAGSFNFDPAFSPDGQRIAFVGRAEGFNVFVVDVDGKNMVRVTQDQGNNEDPSWSPDGRYLAFSSTRTGRKEIWMSTPDGRHQVPISRGGGWSQPSWSPLLE